MPAILGNIIVIALLGTAVFFALRSIIRSKKSGGCSGDCSSCGCSCSSAQKAKPSGRSQL